MSLIELELHSWELRGAGLDELIRFVDYADQLSRGDCSGLAQAGLLCAYPNVDALADFVNWCHDHQDEKLAAQYQSAYSRIRSSLEAHLPLRGYDIRIAIYALDELSRFCCAHRLGMPGLRHLFQIVDPLVVDVAEGLFDALGAVQVSLFDDSIPDDVRTMYAILRALQRAVADVVELGNTYWGDPPAFDFEEQFEFDLTISD